MKISVLVSKNFLAQRKLGIQGGRRITYEISVLVSKNFLAQRKLGIQGGRRITYEIGHTEVCFFVCWYVEG